MTVTYLLPLRRDVAEVAEGELARYLRETSAHADVLVVDGSPPGVFDRHASLFAGWARHLAPAAEDRCLNGKAWGVLTGLRAAATDSVVIADDDVRWDAAALAAAMDRLLRCDLVVPQNFFTPMVWHAAWDTGRILLNRAVDHDWPGTLVVRRSALGQVPRYDGDVLFENCELVRTVRARGGSVIVARGLFVARRPPDAGHFLAQRPRQAYDDLAQPLRLAVLLALLPLAVATRRRGVAGAAAASMALAEVGRRRAGGTAVFPWYCSLLAAPWLGERAVLAWWVVWRRCSGRGVSYGGQRLVRAATPLRVLRRRG